jgi:threonine dehydrogenase-like Zn-dependent dehydrogenase
VPQRNLHRVPDSIPDDIAVFTEPVAAAFQIPAQLNIAATDRIVVLGDGRLGNLCAQVLASIADDVLIVGKHREKLALLEAIGLRTAMVSDDSSAACRRHRRRLATGFGVRAANGAGLTGFAREGRSC